MSSPASRPYAQPMRMHGTNRPDGTAMPYVMHARAKMTTVYTISGPSPMCPSLWKKPLIVISVDWNEIVAMSL